MKIKKLVALALAGTMVFSMAACGDKGEKKTSGGEATSGSEANIGSQNNVENESNGEVNASEDSDTSVETVLTAFAKYAENKDNNFSADMVMNIEMEASGLVMKIDSVQTTKSYEGVTYTKSTSKVDMFGEKDESVDETYTITQEDGTVICAVKSSEDDEWDVYPEFDLDTETESDIDIEELLETAKIEEKGDKCYVTISINAEDMGLSEEDIMTDIPDAKVDVVLTYDTKEEALTEIEIDMDLEIIEEAFAELFGDVKITEFSMKIENIEENDEPIEIPSEIELD